MRIRNLLADIICLLSIIAFVFIVVRIDSKETQTWNCVVDSPKINIYDGDTIKDVRVLLVEEKFPKSDYGEVWHDIRITEDGIELEIDVRINGIDTPEKRVGGKYADGTPRSDESRQLERDASLRAKESLHKLLESNDFKFVLHDVFLGKYAGRIVGSMNVSGQDVSEYMIQEGHAFPYDGGKKFEWARHLDEINKSQ